MKIEVRQTGSISILAPLGRVTIGESAHSLKAALEAAMDGGATHIILDGTHVEYLDSSGIGEMIAAARRLSESGGRVGMCAPSAKVREIMEITGLHALFVLGDTEEAVLAGMIPSSSTSH